MSKQAKLPPDATISKSAAFRFWLKLGCISFGGPAGQIALMHHELVDKRRWISEGRFLHALNYCMLLPGPEAQQLATYLGWLMHRTLGGIVAGVLFVLPSLLLLILLSWLYVAYGSTPLLAAIFAGIKPAVVAIVLQASYRIGARTLKNRWLWGIAMAAFFAIFALRIPFPLIVALAALFGYLAKRYAPNAFTAASPHSPVRNAHLSALIDDHTPAPAHARFQRSRLLRVVFTGLLLWSLPMAALVLTVGWSHTLTQMGWFFTKAALLTFGGAYAVLPYVYQGAVEHYGWLSAAQMIDGLALGETTPGPLIMVLAFVGFIGGHSQQVLGPNVPNAPYLGAVLAACLVTWFTFLPSFVFILAGGPLVEATQRKLAFTAPLTAITAAVVGVIVNLALFFSYHVLWPNGWQGGFDLQAAVIAALAAIALFRYQRHVIEVVAGAAILGVLSTLL